jgi:RecJ-like exonuclease
MGNEKCKVCSGSGKISFSVPTSKVDEKGNVVHEVRVHTCPNCKGTGNA